jgi:hypothetical protein
VFDFIAAGFQVPRSWSDKNYISPEQLISRTVNNRLKKVTDRFLSRSQKGFNRSRQIQEVIINSMETMDFCKRHNIKGAMVSVDVSKAFDSVDHGYMEKVYRFFGLGPRIRKWLSTIGTGRNAQILLANDELSVAFQLEKGCPVAPPLQYGCPNMYLEG